MKRLMIALCLLVGTYMYAENDTTLYRVVTVERDFQPVIQSAGKINQRPAVLQHDLELNPVVYSTYSNPLPIGFNIPTLQVAATSFTPQAPLNGILEGGIGYRNTHLLFGYQINQKKKMSLHLYAKHDAQWGLDALSLSTLGLIATRHFSSTNLYVGVEGNHEFFTYYGKRFNGTDGYKPTRLNDMEATNILKINANIGLQSTQKAPLQYRVQTGYAAYVIDWQVEHQVRTHLDLFWQNDAHGVGAKAYVQNNIHVDGPYLPSGENHIVARHAIRVEPFYEYNSKHIHLHLGVNVDLNVGTGELLSSIKNLSFAPSPNVQFEWHMMDNIFHFYAHAKGSYGIGSLEEYLGYNRYLNIEDGRSFNQPRAYTPIDAQVGFKIRPAKTLLIDIYGGYAYLQEACNMQANLHGGAVSTGVTYYSLWQDDYQRWKAGASMHYHYRDILELNVAGNYCFWNKEEVYDRPDWDARARVDIHFDSKWSIYSENYFAGSRWAYTTQGTKQLKPIISLNIGGQYAINRWLIVYAQVNDYLNRKNDIFYGYQSQGIHFLLGVKWKF